MQCMPFIPEAQAMLELLDQCPRQVEKGRFPVIVIEGLDATGKRMPPVSDGNGISPSVAGIERSCQKKNI